MGYQEALELKKYLIYDQESGDLFWKVSPAKSVKEGSLAGTLNKKGYKVVRFNYKYYKAHRIAWLLFYGGWPKFEIDHINGDRSDNRIANLRLASRVQNLANRQKQKDTSSKYKGVYWNKKEKKWKASIRTEGKKIHLGYFVSEELAAKAYDEAAKKLHGDYAKLNFKEEAL